MRKQKVLCTVDSANLLRLAACGELRRTDSVQQVGEASWTLASSVPGLLFGVFGGATPVGRSSAVGLAENVAATTTSIRLADDQGCDDEDDEFIANIVVEAKKESTGLRRSEKNGERQGLVLAKDADGVERLIDSQLVSEEAVVIRKGKQVRCAGCENWFSDEKESCPTCFRENWQGKGGRKRRIASGLKALAVAVTVAAAALIIYLLQRAEYQIVLPLEMKIFLWILLPFIIAALVFWARKQAFQ